MKARNILDMVCHWRGQGAQAPQFPERNVPYDTRQLLSSSDAAFDGSSAFETPLRGSSG
jgi:hypothetical protein